MQGSASLAEDARQPPYLCPVDLAKLKHAVSLKKEKKKKDKEEHNGEEWVEGRYRALERFCSRMRERDGEEDETDGFWDAFSTWIKGRLREELNSS